jgi:hypothetical protein
MKTLIKIVAMLMLVSCVTKKKIEKYSTHDTVIKEVVKEKIISKDSIVWTVEPFQEDILKAYYECDSLGQLHLTYIDQLKDQAKAKQKVRVVDNYVEIECECDSSTIFAIWKSRFEITTNVSSQNINTSDVSSVSKTKMPWWLIPGLILAFIVGGIIGYIIKKFF